MYWEYPNVLFLLWLLPGMGYLLYQAARRRRAAAERFADATMLERLLPRPLPGRAALKAGALLLGCACLIVAGARPRFGVYFEKVSRRGVDLFVLLDVSRSMLAGDVAPNRLERAKADIRDLLTRLTGDRVGLIAFAGKPVVVVPLTTDQGFYRMALDTVDPTSAPRGGSLIGDAIRKAMEALEPQPGREQVLVLITDGEDQDSFPQEAAKQAAERGLRIFTVGLGDPGEGARIPVAGKSGSPHFLTYQDQEVWSKMDEKLLKEIALTTGGAYIPAQTRAYDLGAIYDEHLSGLARGEISEEKRKRFREQFQLFVGLGLCFLVVEFLIPTHARERQA